MMFESKRKTVGLYLSWWKTWRTLPVRPWIRAAQSYSEGKFDAAQRFYEKGLAKHPHHPANIGARLDLAYCLFRGRRFKDAEAMLRYIIAQAPKVREAYVRLAKLQLWFGQSLEAAWTMRRGLKSLDHDAELVSIFLLAVLENGGPSYLLEEAERALGALPEKERAHPKLNVAQARLAIYRGNYEEGKRQLIEIASRAHPPIEALMILSEILLHENKIAYARQQLRRALVLSSEHPRVHSLLAISYLKSGLFYNPGFAQQLATTACQSSGWFSPREMHVLAESYYHSGDKEGALVVASRAKQVGTRLFGSYKQVRMLEKLIDSISGSQA